MVLEKVLESLLDSKEIQLVNPKGNLESLLEGLMLKLKLPMLWLPDAKTVSLEKTQMLGKIEGRRRRGRQRMRWLDGLTDSKDGEFEQASGVCDGQGSLACCSPWGRKELDTTE